MPESGEEPGQWEQVATHPASGGTPPKDLAMWTHLSALIQLVSIPGFVGPLVCWLMWREKDPWLDEQGKEALNFQLTLLGAMFAFGVVFGLSILLTLGLSLLFLPLFIVVLFVIWVVGILFPILGALEVNKGNSYRYPFAVRLIK